VLARYVLLGAAVGLPVGVLWVLLSPRVVLTSQEPVSFAEAYPQGFATADLTLGALLLVVGLLLGAVASARLNRSGFVGGWVHVVGVIAAAGVCAAVARVIGWWVAGRRFEALGDGTSEAPLSLGASGVLLLGVFAALLVVVFASALARDGVVE
jgi:hypothetical protein